MAGGLELGALRTQNSPRWARAQDPAHRSCWSRTQSGLTNHFFFPLLSFPEFQELCWNTKPRCQRHLASAVFHHKTLRHENFLPCDSSGCLLPGVPAMPWPCWKSCQGGLWSHLWASLPQKSWSLLLGLVLPPVWGNTKNTKLFSFGKAHVVPLKTTLYFEQLTVITDQFFWVLLIPCYLFQFLCDGYSLL